MSVKNKSRLQILGLTSIFCLMISLMFYQDSRAQNESTSVTVTNEYFTDVSWSPDNQLLAVGGGEGIYIFTSELDQLALLQINSQSTPINSVAWSPDSTKLASANLDGTVRIWNRNTNTNTFTLNRTLTGGTETQYSVSWSPDGGKLASMGVDYLSTVALSTIYIWNTFGSWKLANQIPSSPNRFIYFQDVPLTKSIDWSDDGTSIIYAASQATFSSEGDFLEGERFQVYITKVSTGVTLGKIEPFDPAIAIAIARNTIGMLAVGRTPALDIYNISTLQLLNSYQDMLEVVALSWNPNGAMLAFTNNNVIQIMEVFTGTIVAENDLVSSRIKWSPDGNSIAILGGNLIRIWDVSNVTSDTGKSTVTPFPTDVPTSTPTSS